VLGQERRMEKAVNTIRYFIAKRKFTIFTAVIAIVTLLILSDINFWKHSQVFKDFIKILTIPFFFPAVLITGDWYGHGRFNNDSTTNLVFGLGIFLQLYSHTLIGRILDRLISKRKIRNDVG